MKRRMEFSYKDQDGPKARVVVSVDGTSHLTPAETGRMITDIGNGVMNSMAAARYLGADLCDIKVK